MWIAGSSGWMAVPSATAGGIGRGESGRTVRFPLFQRLWAVMSPWEVVARMSSSAVPSFFKALLTRP